MSIPRPLSLGQRTVKSVPILLTFLQNFTFHISDQVKTATLGAWIKNYFESQGFALENDNNSRKFETCKAQVNC